MRIMLTGKALLLFSLIFMYLINFLSKAQPQYPFFRCNNASTYTPHSSYSNNLHLALSSLPNTNSSYGYFNSSAGNGTNTANAIALCRGDVDLNMCQSCLEMSIFQLRVVCPNQTEAVIYYELCLLKYSNAPILGNNDMENDIYYLVNNNEFDDKKKFNGFLEPFVNKLRREAASGNSTLKFAMDTTSGPANYTLYGLTQCIPILSEAQCNSCLAYAITQFQSCCDGSAGVIVLMARCNVRYEIYDFFGNQALPPSSVPQSSPSSAPQSSPSSVTQLSPPAGYGLLLLLCVVSLLSEFQIYTGAWFHNISALNVAMHFHGWLSFFFIFNYKLPVNKTQTCVY